MVHGEIFYAFILKKFTFSYPVSSPAFLDALSLACVLVLAWNSLELITAFFNKYFQSVEKEKQKIYMSEYTYPIIFGITVGTLARIYMLRTDYRQYPTYLHGKIIHIALGFIAAALGTVAGPSIMKEDFTAVTFLTLAASQFREVRNMERNTLTELDNLRNGAAR